MPVAELKQKYNGLNWRKHPKAQRQALHDLIDKVGVVQAVIYNERTGRLVDGHLRVALAADEGQAEIPVTIVDLTEDEERLVLATFDPVAAMAQVDEALLRELASSQALPEGSLSALVDSVLTPFGSPDNPQAEWNASGMPDFENKESSFRSIVVHFKDQGAVDRFAKVTKAKLSEKTKYIWFA